jgi:hypothetical protein
MLDVELSRVAGQFLVVYIHKVRSISKGKSFFGSRNLNVSRLQKLIIISSSSSPLVYDGFIFSLLQNGINAGKYTSTCLTLNQS